MVAVVDFDVVHRTAYAAVADVLKREHKEGTAAVLESRDKHSTLTRQHLNRVTAIAPFVPADASWMHMTPAQRRQVLAEVVEFVLYGAWTASGPLSCFAAP
jgi:hypothetical protein